MSRALCVALASLLCAAPAFAAGEKVAVVISGDCRDPELINAARDLGRDLAKSSAVKLVDEQQVLEKLGRGPTRSVDEIQRQIDTAQQQFYSAQYYKAIDQLDAALAEIQRLPPGVAHWQLWVSASILEGLTRSRVKKGSGSEDAFRRVLRIDPTYQLDPDYFAPSTVQLFERIRKETAAAKKGRLLVKSTPAGATVFIEGRALGKTPFSAELPRGAYQVIVGRDEVFSLPREVNLDDEAELHVDLRFESSIDTQRAPCIQASKDERTRLDNAVKLGSMLDVDEMVVLRFERQKVGPSWLAATLVGIKGGGEKIREGGLQVSPRGGLTDQGISELARFVATGEATPNVVSPPAEPTATAANTAGAQPPRTASPSAETAPASATAVEASASAPSWQVPTGKVLTVAGGSLLVVGGIFQVAALQSYGEFQSWVDAGSNPQGAAAAREASDRGDVQQTVAVVSLGVGAAALGTGLYLWLAPHDGDAAASPHAAILPTRDGGGVFVLSGEF